MTTRHRITTTVLVAIGLAASSGSALASPSDINANGSYVPAGSPGLQTQATAPPASPGPCSEICSGSGYSPGRPAATPTVVRVSAPANGFDWGDAGIGAAGGVALTMIGVGGALVASGRRSRRTHGTPAVTG